jgi:hypothetical protein
MGQRNEAVDEYDAALRHDPRLVLCPGNSWTMFMRLVYATSVAFFREKTNATEVACTGNAAQLFARHNTKAFI